MSLITEGDESQNIRLLDGDTLKIGKSPIVLRDQLLKAGQSNLSPQFMEVFVTGRVNIPGGVRIPQGSSLNQAIALAGGTKLLKGKVEFVRFNREGTIDRRIFAYKAGAAADAPNNPVLADGDLIRVNESILSGGLNVLNELIGPLLTRFIPYLTASQMTTNSMSNQPEMPSRLQNEDEINLRQVFDALLRHKFLIAKITAASILFTGLYAFTRKPVWQGQFEIVLASTQGASSPPLCFKVIRA